MSRWHCNDCPGPDINVPEDGIPVCRACEASPNLDEIVRKAQDSSVLRINVPEDRPVGSMNLSWPASVSWTRNGVSLLHSTHTDAREDEHGAAAVNLEAVTERITPNDYAPGAQWRTSAVYTNRLSTTQLRLLRLDPVATQNRDTPLHVTLETYELDDCPEYEAISYTWAGEDGDPMPCQPIYIGPYWDVLIQTENCSSMLRDLRPCGNHPFRRLWVDAICINQNDILERDGQVSRMGDIYNNCMRVVVYLPVESPGNFRSLGTGKANRPRIRLTQEVLLDLLRTRYFTRVWIIQELILPPMVVFHLKDEDWYFSPLGSDIDWSQTRAPWAVDMANPGSFGKLRLVDVLARTWYSKAADERDKIFGVLGLLQIQFDTINRHRFEPNYSLSARDVFIGAAAYVMLVERQMVLLVRAIGNDHAASGYPSWSPDFNHQPSPFALTDIYSTFSTKVPEYWKAFAHSLKRAPVSTMYGIYPRRSRISSECHKYVHRGICSCRCGGFDHVGQDDLDSVTKSSIDSATGALILDCTRIFREPVSLADTVSRPTPWCENNVTFTKRIMRPEGLILFQWKGVKSGLLIMVSNSRGDHGNHLREKYTLLVAGQSSGTPILLFLQPEANTSSSSFVLKHSHPIVGMSFFTRQHKNSRRESEKPVPCGNLFETLGKLRRLSALPLNELVEKTRADRPRAVGQDPGLITEDLLMWFFPGQGVILQDVLAVLSELLTIESLLGVVRHRGNNEVLRESQDWSRFLEQYKTFLKRKCPDLQPRLLEGTTADPRYLISFLYPNDRWSEITEHTESSDTVLNAHNDDFEPAGRQQRQRLINHTQHTNQEVVVVTLDLRFWCYYLLRLEILKDMRILRELKVEVNEVEYEGKPEHRDACMHKLPKEAREELGFVWEQETVTIV